LSHCPFPWGEHAGTDLAAELLNTADDLCHVSSVEKIDRLKQSGLGHAVRLAEVDERLNVFHL